MAAADDDRYLDTLTRAHERVHEDERSLVKLQDEGHWRQHDSEHSADGLWRTTHIDKHADEGEAVRVAIEAEQHRLAAHREAHDAAHLSHESLHLAYERAHEAMHAAEGRAQDRAESSMDKRLESMNQFREQMREQAASFVAQAAFDAFKDESRMSLTKADQAMDRRFDELRTLIGTEREERRDMVGQRKGATDNRNAIYASIGIVGTLLGILIIIMNILSTNVISVP